MLKTLVTAFLHYLEGLKTAFITSVAGLGSGIIQKFIFELKATRETKGEVAEDDPIELLKGIVSGITKLETSSREIEKSIVSCFRSDEEYSLISQLKLIRQEIVDSRKEIIESFNSFAEKIVESNTDALVKALEKVIADFNALLNELVSESFKELSSAMIKLTEWQENYKTHVDEMQDKTNTLITEMNNAVNIMENSSKRLIEISNNLEKIDNSISSLSVSANDIESHIENLKLQNETLKEGIVSIKQIGEDAKTVIPTITENINNLSSKLEESVLNVTTKLESNTQFITEFVDKSIKDIQGAVDNHTESIQKSIDNIDKGLEEELTKALSSLTGSLASLSAKFVEDYQPLTERLREVVRLAEKSNEKHNI